MPTPVHQYLDRILDHVRADDSGQVADYIAELRMADPNKLGLAVCTTTGHLYSAGDDTCEFSIQSISKPFVYALALEELGAEEVHSRVGVEPSGEAFNDISLEEDTHRPANPMINAGAITVNQLINGSDSTVDERVEKIRAFMSRLAGRELTIDHGLAETERGTAHRNLAIAHLLSEYGMLQDEVEDAVESYTQQCSILVTVRDLAVMAATLANGGVQPVTGERVIGTPSARVTQAVMISAGMYDASGRWMVNVGIPAKSGVSGGLIGTMPGQLGMASLSPRLDRQGNSVRGVKIFRELSYSLGLNLVAADYYAAPCIKSVERCGEETLVQLQGTINFVAAEKILYDLKKMGVTRDLLLDVSAVTSFNRAGLTLIMGGLTKMGHVRVFDPEGAMPDYEFSDGTRVQASKDFSFVVGAPLSKVHEAIANPGGWEQADCTSASQDRLVWDLGDSELVFDLEDASSGGTRVTLTFDGQPSSEMMENLRQRIVGKLHNVTR
ncbi:Glutaminase [Corynebacterium capitovis DSM 44611]|nr:glutaminase [Corynebacterium capitovis]WKD56632.1 Glutaminase [Corynebacterium capitovis DSM 44611]